MCRMTKYAVLSAFIVCLASPAALASAQPGTGAAGAARVLSATGSRSDGSAGLGDRVTLRVQNLDSLAAEVNGDCRNVLLFLSGIAVPGMPPETCDVKSGTIVYLLDRDPQNDANNRAWHQLLGRPRGEIRPVALTVGTPALIVSASDVKAFPLLLASRAKVALYFAGLASFLALVVFLCMRTNIIRRPASALTSAAPFSLSRTLALYWTVLVMAGYVFLWIVSGETDTITGSVLALIGITGGSGLGAWMIDASRVPVAASSRGFFTDLLSGGSGAISIHRLQLVAWSAVLGAIFCFTLYTKLFMPQLSGELLALLGLSGSTYLFAKFTERPSASLLTTTARAR